MSDTIIDLCSHLSSSSNNKLLWSYSENLDLYNKHTQYITVLNNIPSPISIKVLQESLYDIEEEPKVCESPKDINSNGLLRQPLSVLLNEEKKYIKKKKELKEVITPLELIMRECDSPDISKDYIKETIINLISRNEYIKVFGQKKSADTMSAFINNKWNKSMVFFISFLFDKKIIYNKNEIIYEKNEGIITI